MHSSKIAILFDTTRKYDREILKGIARYSKENSDWATYLLPPRYINGANTSRALIDKIIEWSPDGIITRTFRNWERFKELKVPLIISPFTNIVPGEINVFSDDIDIGRQAAIYFIQKGFQNFTFIGKDDFYFSSGREKGYVEYINANNLNFKKPPSSIQHAKWFEIPYLLSEWLRYQPKPMAIFAANDEFSMLAVEAVKICDLHCPSEVAILGCDNDEYICEISEPHLSSIDLNASITGYEVAKKMNALIEGPINNKENIITPPKGIVSRKSTEIIAVKDLEVQKAIKFIIKNSMHENIRVPDVVNATNLSRRLLEIRFKRNIGISILNLVKKYRVDHFKKLLCETNLSVKEIFVQMNFSNVESAARYFKNETGLTPSEYRKKFKL